MKIKIFIVTYLGEKRLPVTLPSLFESDINNFEHEVFLINNHTKLIIPEEFKGKISVINNNLRPNWSTGHLSRNWNQAIVNGFKSLKNPDCDIVVCSQDDSVFKKDWASKCIELHKKYSFIQNGHGDQFHSYLPESIIKTGLWDERFCGLFRQAADYFWRCVMHNKNGSSIQDTGHTRVLNPILENNEKGSRQYLVDPDVRKIDEKQWSDSDTINNSISLKLILEKYGFDPYPWTKETISRAGNKTLSKNYITYPYFEKDIENLAGKNYLI
tara:strand:+ start:457 stop:1269 length:813 start_codon:yes stop_codon:yes gene_type:complete